jgi:DNA-binding FadR family transcriptional regulator
MAHSLKLVPRDARTLPDRIADHFVASIFVGALQPGERLPPDRELAQQLGVDRTSLRMAMQRLSHLGLVKAVRGSGVRVLDYRHHAGIDLLAAVFSLPDLALGGSFMLESLDDWLESIPAVMARAARRLTHEAARQHDATLLQQLGALEAGADTERLAAYEVELQDSLARILGNTTLILLGNSNRAARRRMAALFLETLDAAELRSHIDTHRAFLRKALEQGARAGDAHFEELAADYRTYLDARTQKLRRRLQAMPISPSLITPASAPGKPNAGRARKASAAKGRKRQ